MSINFPVTVLSSRERIYPGEVPAVKVTLAADGPQVRVCGSQVTTSGWHKIFDQLGGSKGQQMALESMYKQMETAFIDPVTNEQKMRKTGEPWYLHLRALTLILIYELGVMDPDMVTASLGRDLLEDPIAVRNVSYESEKFTAIDFLTRSYGERVTRLIQSQTKPPALVRRELMSVEAFEAQKLGAYLKLYQQGDPVEQISLKLAARIHNLRTAITPDLQCTEIIESIRYLEPLVEHFMGDKERTLLRDAMEPYMKTLSDSELLTPIKYPSLKSGLVGFLTKALGRGK